MHKILLIGDRNIYLKRLCNFLAVNGFSVHLICRHRHGIESSEFKRITHLHTLNSTSLIRKYYTINQLINHIKPDIVHVHYLARDAVIPAIRKDKTYKLFISVWGSDINLYADSRLTRFFQNVSLTRCDRIHTFSSYLKLQIKKRYPKLPDNKFDIFSFGIDYQLFHTVESDAIEKIKKDLHINGDTLVILSYRNHKPLYNHHIILRTIEKVRSVYPNVKYIFTRGSYNKDYFQQNITYAAECGWQENVVFIDRWLSKEQLAALIHLSSISISIPDSDGMPATLFEIMATPSIPVVGALEAYNDFFTDGINGFVVPDVTDVESLADIIVRALNFDPTSKQQMTRTNNAYIKTSQNWEYQTRKILDFYNQQFITNS